MALFLTNLMILLIQWLYGPIGPPYAGPDWYVDDDAVGFQDGSPAKPFDTIQEAINAADADDGHRVIIRNGTYKGAGNRNIAFLGKAITVQCDTVGNPPPVCIVDCEHQARGFKFINSETTLSVLKGVTIRNGEPHEVGPMAENRGGGILIFNAATIQDVKIEDCTVVNADGGGIFLTVGAAPVILNTVIEGCSSTGDGGGLMSFGAPHIENLNVTGCSAARHGGGIYLEAADASPNLTGTTIQNCSAGDDFSFQLPPSGTSLRDQSAREVPILSGPSAPVRLRVAARTPAEP